MADDKAGGTAANAAPEATASGVYLPPLKRCASTGDVVWLTSGKSKKPAELQIGDDIDQELSATTQSLNMEARDNLGGITFSATRPSRWGGTTNKIIHPILEEGSSDDSSIATATVTDPVAMGMKSRPRRASIDQKSVRGSQKIEKPKCSQSLMMRWLASSTIPPGSRTEDPCKNLAFTFKSRDVNAISPTNW